MRTTLPWLLIAFTVLATACRDEIPPVDPKVHAEGLYIHATALYLQGNFDESLKAFEEVKKILPNDPRLPAALGEVYLAQGKLKEALAKFEEAAKNDPRRSTNWSRVGFIRAQFGDVEEARSALRKALALNPNDHTALEALGDLDLKEKNLDGAVTNWTLAADVCATVDQSSSLYVQAARELVKAGRNDDALKLLAKAVAKGEGTSELFSEYGEHLVRHRRFEDAVAAYTTAAQKNPNDPGLWELVGELQVALDKPADAMTSFKESLKVKDRALPHLALARIHKARKEDQAAKEELDKALETATGEEDRETLELARVLKEFGRRQDALKLYETLSSEPGREKDAELHVETAKLARDLGQSSTVIAACARALKAGATARCP